MHHELSITGSPRRRVVSRRLTAMVAGATVLLTAGCGSSRSTGEGLGNCKTGWESPSSLTTDPSAANQAMQRSIAELISQIDGSSGQADNDSIRVTSIAPKLLGAANAVLHQYPGDVYLGRYSDLRNYANEACIDSIDGQTYLTPAYLGAVGALASAGITVEYARVTPSPATN